MLFSRFLNSRLFDEANPDGGNGGGGGNPAQPPQQAPAFDSAAFESKILGEFDKRVNALDKRFKGLDTNFVTFSKGLDGKFEQLFERLKPAEAPAPPDAPVNQQPETPAAPPQNANPPAQPHKPSPSEIRLQKQLEEVQKRMEAAENVSKAKEVEIAKRELSAAVKSEIGLHQFATARDAQDLFALLNSNVVRGDDGVYYGPEGVPLSEYVKSEYQARPNWQPAKQVGGSGAPAPSVVNGRQTFDTDRIAPNMSKDERAQLASAIQQAIQNR